MACEVLVSEALGFVFVQSLTAKDWLAFLDEAKGTDEEQAWLVARFTFGGDGRRLFRDEDTRQIAELPSGMVARIARAILRESNLDDDDRDERKRLFAKRAGRRLAVRLARHFRVPDTDAFLASLTPHQYEELCFSWEYDPPVDDLLRDLLVRVGQLLALTVNINTGKDAQKATLEDYVTSWGEDFADDDDEDEGEDGTAMVAAAMAAKDELRAALPMGTPPRLAGPMPRNPRVRPVPAHIFAALTGRQPD